MNLNINNWPAWSKSVAYPAEIEEYSPAAIASFMKEMADYIVDAKNIRPQFKALNTIQMISFRTPEEQQFYQDAWERFCKEKAKIEARMDEGSFAGNGGMQILAQFLKFRQAAELIRAEYIADAMYENVTTGKQQACAAMNFKHSISKCVYVLVHKYNVPREKISLIWGGGVTSTSAEKKKKIALRKKLEANASIMSMLEDMDIDMVDVGLGNAEEQKQNEFLKDESLKLGAQTKDERQRQIDRFQSGKADYCFFTFKAGGVGLSLHHTDEMTNKWTEGPYKDAWLKDRLAEGYSFDNPNPNKRITPGKVRRKPDSCYAFLEDIPLIPTRQRICFLSPTYSAMELVQGLGRCPRLTSLSDTPQVILFYKGTIEERVAAIVSIKLKCLRKVVAVKESWETVILGGVSKEDEGNSEVKMLQAVNEGKPIEDESGEDDTVNLDNNEEEE